MKTFRLDFLLSILIGVLFYTVPSSGQLPTEGTVLVLSKKLGSEIDSLENIYYGILPKLKRVKQVIFIKIRGKLYLKVDYYKQNKLKTKYISIPEKAFQEKKLAVDLTPPMPDIWLYEHSGQRLQDENTKILEVLEPGTDIRVVYYNNDSFRGKILKNTNRTLTLKSKFFTKHIPYPSIHHCIRYTPREKSMKVRKWITIPTSGIFSSAGYAVRNTNQSKDRQALFVLSSGVIGYFVSKYIYDFYYSRFPKSERINLLVRK